MGKRGPPPAPSILKYIRGNPHQGKLNENEPTPDLVPDNFPAPAILDEKGTEIWNDMVRILSGMRVLTEADIPVLSRYCIHGVLYLQCYAKVRALGEEYIHKEDDPDNPGEKKIKYMQVAPWASQMLRHHSEMLKIEKEFGMTPSSRSQVVANGPREVDPIASFAAQRGGSAGA